MSIYWADNQYTKRSILLLSFWHDFVSHCQNKSISQPEQMNVNDAILCSSYNKPNTRLVEKGRVRFTVRILYLYCCELKFNRFSQNKLWTWTRRLTYMYIQCDTFQTGSRLNSSSMHNSRVSSAYSRIGNELPGRELELLLRNRVPET